MDMHGNMPGAAAGIDGEAQKHARQTQQHASDPTGSFWVEANAGTGKTTVLTARVIRLLLSASDPEKLLCLTYTRAGAAEMENRVRDRLATLSVSNDPELRQHLIDITGSEPDGATMRRARSLFVKVLDSPAGCNIQTIHSFCQSILARFPLEAGLAPHMTVLDPDIAQALLTRSRTEVLAEARHSTAHTVNGENMLLRALDMLAEEVDEDTLHRAITKLATQPGPLFDFQSAHGGDASARMRIIATAQHIKEEVEPESDSVAWLRDYCSDTALADHDKLRAAAAILAENRGKNRRQDGESMLRWLDSDTEQRVQHWDSWCLVFLTAQGSVRKWLVSEKLSTALGSMRDEAERVFSVITTLKARRSIQLTGALMVIAEAAIQRYRDMKTAIGAVDYADLIHFTQRLLEQDGGAGWVQYKLDAGIDHILLDEAQDTNPEQWAILQALCREFHAGHGERADAARTLFVVGDAKQSIYGFQGASPDEYKRIRSEEAQSWHTAQRAWEQIALDISFRSAGTILTFVDTVFARHPELLGNIPHHRAARLAGGRIESWPGLAEGEEKDSHDRWQPPPVELAEYGAEYRLAQNIALRIRHWLDQGEPIVSGGNEIRPGDIMILLRRRNPLMVPIVRALKRLAIPVAGLDRQSLAAETAVQDLCKLAQALLLPEDDFSVAWVLRSPLGGLSEDELFHLAARRGRKQTLWNRLLACRHDDDATGNFARHIMQWHSRLDYLTPFDLFTTVLGPGGGRGRFLARLGHDADEALDEFLSLALTYESLYTPSLQGFLHWFATGKIEITRELGQSRRDEVRVMTIHGAKGLEAPIVILPDTANLRAGNWNTPIWVREGGSLAPIWAPRQDFRSTVSEAQRLVWIEQENKEQSRLLYVALTRARDRLVLCYPKDVTVADPTQAEQTTHRAGKNDSQSQSAGSWYDIVRAALSGTASLIKQPWHEFASRHFSGQQPFPLSGEVLVLGDEPTVETLPHSSKERTQAAFSAPIFPVWLGHRISAARRVADDIVRPSRAMSAGPIDESWEMRRGTIIHALLRVFPELPEDRRSDVATRWLARNHRDIDPSIRASIVQTCLRVLRLPELVVMLNRDWRAEVPIIGQIDGRTVRGQMDVLSICDEAIDIVDYKTGPGGGDIAVRSAYIEQMALYRALVLRRWPSRSVRCWLVWVDQLSIQAVCLAPA